MRKTANKKVDIHNGHAAFKQRLESGPGDEMLFGKFIPFSSSSL